jgi:hypothetical protein
VQPPLGGVRVTVAMFPPGAPITYTVACVSPVTVNWVCPLWRLEGSPVALGDRKFTPAEPLVVPAGTANARLAVTSTVAL